MIRQCCTKDCPDRHPACHGTCERYKAWKLAMRAEKAYTKNRNYAEKINKNDFDAEFWMGSQRK